MTAHASFPTPDGASDPARRDVLTRAAALGALAATVSACTDDARSRPAAAGPPVFRFRGPRQAGVTTPQQTSALVTAYDLAPAVQGAAGVRALREVLGRWTRALAETLDGEVPPPSPVRVKGVAEGSVIAGAGKARLTATVAIGSRLPRLLCVAAPDALRELPPFPDDRLDPAFGGGDLLLQLCADDPRVTAATASALTRLAGDTLRPRWRQTGSLAPAPAGQTPRNHLGFKDGTEHPTPKECERWVWSDDATYLVVRRIHIDVAGFARLGTRRQEEIIGRHRASGAPLGQEHEHDDVDIFAKTPQGKYVIPLRSHVRAASPRLDAGARMLRRGYGYDAGPDDRGLLFLAFMRDPALFARVQHRMTATDDLSRFIEHRGSAVAYVLPGALPGEDLGARLLA
ncbi:Dyp-type peroxidase [Streptomyces turgidiscabies]|uniref:Putative Tat-translocated enzyme n=1 Tax=Streptomyces turgidiscabies (strain Car8) TaxID=698760 RepID=L7EW83_STRT8|nr:MULTISPECIES: Dyp-type peroxidase [Streptomyces]ELP62640.1 putative Tat-translocated enzyme [Streptomyces turgidiscabies Car8]MDX3494946.1 Dyp-type peroxidase [Streptomyces turgidiscabies]GAQ70819.1 deferrochelatase/peroxidase EfeB precursor [Streptomyces turgidiscabies]